MLSEKLIPKLRTRFPDRRLSVSSGKPPVAVFPAVYDQVGDIEIHDDGDELTLYVGPTHGHFSCYDDALSDDERQDRTVDEVLAFLDEVFADRIEFWSNGGRMGGWHVHGRSNPLSRRARRFVWSGPIA
jgi:hypothetical protein